MTRRGRKHLGIVRDDGDIQLPPFFDAIVGEVCRRDAATFEANPHLRSFRRAYVPGELWPALPRAGTVAYVEVTYIGEGLRQRRPVMRSVP